MGFVLSEISTEAARESTLQQFADVCSHAHGIPCFSISDVRVLFLCQDLLQSTLAPPFALCLQFGQFSEG